MGGVNRCRPLGWHARLVVGSGSGIEVLVPSTLMRVKGQSCFESIYPAPRRVGQSRHPAGEAADEDETPCRMIGPQPVPAVRYREIP